jgi:nucleoid DNA-binding protein
LKKNKPKPLTKKQLIRAVGKKVVVDGKPVFTNPEIEILLTAFAETIEEKLVENHRVRLENIGSFYCDTTKQRKRYNPNTGKDEIHPERRIIKFKFTEETQVRIRTMAEEYDKRLEEENDKN